MAEKKLLFVCFLLNGEQKEKAKSLALNLPESFSIVPLEASQIDQFYYIQGAKENLTSLLNTLFQLDVFIKANSI